jgi:HK97 family phage prohead protease
VADSERRYLDCSELRAADASGALKIVGYAAVFNALTDERMFGGAFREQIAPGAFARFLRTGRDVVALYNHDRNAVLGRLSNGTLTLQEDETGLWMEIALPDTTLARDLHRLVQRRDVTQASFDFELPPGGDRWERSGKTPVRTLVELGLNDVSVVTVPAYPTTTVAARQFAAEMTSGADSGDVDGAREREHARRQLQLLELA